MLGNIRLTGAGRLDELADALFAAHEEIEEFFRQRPFVGARVKALVTDNVFIEEEGGYRLSPGSYLFFRVILGYRRVVFGPIKSGG
jgi:hypothetical protein